MDPNQSDAAVGAEANSDKSNPEGLPAAADVNAAEGQAGDQGEKGQPSESSTENHDQETFQERIDNLTGKYRTAERDAEYWRERAEQAERQIPAPEPEIRLDKSLQDFNGDESAFAKYVADEAVKATQAVTDEVGERTRALEGQREFIQRESDFAKGLEDYDAVTRNPALQISADMKDFIQGDEKGPELLYFLGRNPEIAAKISMLPPMQAGAEMRVLQVTELSKPEVSTSKAPAPPTTLKGQQPATAIDPYSPDSDQLPMDEWAKRRNKKLINQAENKAG